MNTPGPWQIIMGGLQGDDGFAIGSKTSREVVCERWPCTCDNADRVRMIADCKLIAAAPEMLDLLREIRDADVASMKELAEIGVYPEYLDHKTIEKIVALVARVEMK